MNISDLIITISYFSIPVQLLVALWQYPRLAKMPPPIFLLLVLFALFILMCGIGHLLRALQLTETSLFYWINLWTAVVSATTAMYLLPLVPSLLSQLDGAIQELVHLNEETTESKNKLFTFMAFLCHEIRNPLFCITSSISSLEDSHLSPDQTVAVGSIMDSSFLMLRLVNDVLDLSKIDSGKLLLEEKVFCLHRMLSNLQHTIGTQVSHQKGGVQFVVHVGQRVPQSVRGDSVRLLQIIYNLLSNALKFTQQGEISLQVETVVELQQRRTMTNNKDGGGGGSSPSSRGAGGAHSSNKDTTQEVTMRERTASMDPYNDAAVVDETTVFSMSLLDNAERGESSEQPPPQGSNGSTPHNQDDDDSVVTLKITISDTGVGIAPDRLATIFEPYSQAKLSDYRKHGGTGLGLSIISGLTSAMGGTISATSEIGVGSTFCVHLPLKVPVVVQDDDLAPPPHAPLMHSPKKQQQHQQFGALHLSSIDAMVDSSAGSTLDSTESLISTMTTTTTPAMPTMSNKNNNDSSFDYNDVGDPLLPMNATVAAPPTSATMDQQNSSMSNLGDALGLALMTNGGAPGVVVPTTCTVQQQQQVGPATAALAALNNHDTATATPTVLLQPLTTPRKKKRLEPILLPPNDHVVLIVDDNIVNQKILAKMLTHFQVEYRVVGNGKEAVDMILQNSRNGSTANNDSDVDTSSLPRFGLILMDLSMPVMDGYEATAALRHHDIKIPIVALTANALDRERDRAIAAGATDFRTKPILRQDLHAVCQNYLLQLAATV